MNVTVVNVVVVNVVLVNVVLVNISSPGGLGKGFRLGSAVAARSQVRQGALG